MKEADVGLDCDEIEKLEEYLKLDPVLLTMPPFFFKKKYIYIQNRGPQALTRDNLVLRQSQLQRLQVGWSLFAYPIFSPWPAGLLFFLPQGRKENEEKEENRRRNDRKQSSTAISSYMQTLPSASSQTVLKEKQSIACRPEWRRSRCRPLVSCARPA